MTTSRVRHPRAGRMGVACLALGLALVSGLAFAADTLEGPVWRVTRLQGVDQKALAAVAHGVTVRFDQGRLQGFGGCNRLAGSYTLDGDRLRVGPLAGTMMACPEPAMSVETAFKKVFAGTLAFRVDQAGLTLIPEAATDPVLVFAAEPPPRLEGVRWEVTGFNNGRQAVVGPLTGTTLTVTFEADAVTGDAGCNRFRAPYTRDGNRLTVGAPIATREQCRDEVMEQERQFLAAVQSATTWAIDHGMLDMHRPDGERVLHARPPEGP